MKTFISIIISLVILGHTFESVSQTIIYGSDEISQKNNSDVQAEVLSPMEKNLSRLSYSFNIGSSFSTLKNSGNLLSYYSLPQIKYKLKPTIHFSAGILFQHTSFNQFKNSEKTIIHQNRTYLITGVDYTREKLRISGEILYGLNKDPYNPLNGKNSPEYFLKFDAEYKITENISIGLQIINQNRDYYNPFMPGYYNPYNRYSPFGRYY